ncbi:MAG TPA: hypothetical protein VK815_14025 [Candidatus Acidoferrales bacterium]|nr:hypothetical protein [Candidatus Acidoferrales bacterium]
MTRSKHSCILMIALTNQMRRRIAVGGMIAAGLLALTAGAAGPLQPMELRLGSGEKSIERYQEYGYNAAIIGDVTQLATFDAACPGAIPAESDLRNRIERQRKKFQKDYDRANALGLAVGLLTDEVSLPTPVWKQLPSTDGNGGIDFDSPAFWNLYRAKYREVLRAYPRVAYVVVRTGENYSHAEEGFTGHTVSDLSGGYDDAYFRHMTRLIEETRKVVVDEFGRSLIWRTWDLGNDGFHANPKVYDRVLAGLTNRTGLVFAIKHTQTDFWRYNDFNPMIGRGGVPAVVEFQCAREYEGKGAFPNYVGSFFAEDMRHAAALGAKGAWIWDFGGGWGGPFLKSDRWVRLNVFATTQLAQNPDLSPRAIAQEWAAKEFGAKAATNVAEMLMLSSECVRKCMYIEAYARDHKGWKPSLNLMRDDIIRGVVLKELYDGSKQSLPEVFAEKSEAVALAGKMRSLFEASRDDIVAARGKQTYEESLSSLIYLQNLTGVVGHCVNGMFAYCQWQETSDPAAAAKARVELQAWSGAWTNYQTEVPKLPGAASLYHSLNRTQNPGDHNVDKGTMVELCEDALHKLATADAGRASVQAQNAAVQN